MMMLKYRSHQSSSNLVLLWRAHSQQMTISESKNGERERVSEKSCKSNNSNPNEQRHATLIRENWTTTPKKLCTQTKPKKRQNERRTRKKSRMLKWKYKFSVHPNHLYYCEWEIVHLAKLLLFMEAQHLSASRWFPISFIHFQPARASRRLRRYFSSVAAYFLSVCA